MFIPDDHDLVSRIVFHKQSELVNDPVRRRQYEND